MKIVVLAGGTSTEREISIVSGTKVCQALQSRGHQAVLVDVFCGLEGADPETVFNQPQDPEAAAAYMSGFNGQIEEMKKTRRSFFGPQVLALCEAADVVFMALHGLCGEDGKIQAVFDLMGIRYTGSGYLGSALAMDKKITKQLFREGGIPTPQGIVVKKSNVPVSAAECKMPLPCVVKTPCGGSSVGVYIAGTEEEFSAALADGFTYEDTLIVEQYIRGREFSVGVVDGTAYPVIEIAPKEGFYDYKNKYSEGSTVETCPAQLTEDKTKELQHWAEEAYRVLQLGGYGRMDFMMDQDEKVYCLEANTLPGMTPTSLLPQEAAVLGYSFAELCEKLIEVSEK